MWLRLRPFWTQLARLAERQGGFGWAHKVIKGGEGRETARRLGATRGFYFFAASPLSSASDKTAMIRWLGTGLKRYQNCENRIDGSIYRQLSLWDRH